MFQLGAGLSKRRSLSTSWLGSPFASRGQALPGEKENSIFFPQWVRTRGRSKDILPFKLQLFFFIICLYFEFETLQTFGVAKVQVFWDIRGIQVFGTRLQQILIPGGSSGCSSLVAVDVKDPGGTLNVPEVAGDT